LAKLFSLLIAAFVTAVSLGAEPLQGSTVPGIEAPEILSQSVVLMDSATGTVLYNKNGDDIIPPASLTKLMTIHIALEEIAEGRASPDEIVNLPQQSWAINQPPLSSLMFLAAGQQVSLWELLLGLAVSSGNDAAVAVALRFAPSVEAFAERMNNEARGFGMTKTRFVEPSGISEFNFTTAMEYASFCRNYLILHPEALRDLHSQEEFAYPKRENVAKAYWDDPRTIVQHNRNNLLGRVDGVDGLKTGYIDESGYNIALTAERRGTRFIAVILGAPATPDGIRIRDEDGRRLLEWGFDNFKTIRTAVPPLEAARVWKGRTNQTGLVPAEGERNALGYNWVFTTYAGRGASLRWETELAEPLIAPLPAGAEAGTIALWDEYGELKRVPLITSDAVEQGHFFKRLWDSIRLFFQKFSKG
jgi:D-alanyl-D-alanine carboxypeptidase (penicillin-binding protein 5/6)